MMSFMLLATLYACKKDDPDAENISEDLEALYGVDHQITTQSVADQCFDGAMNALFMPQGADTPQDFLYPVYIPSLDELPLSYEISLREPFVGMEVTAEDGGSGSINIVDGHMEEVVLGATFGSCVATMDVEASIVPSGDYFAFTTTITMSDLRGDDQDCPVPQVDPCTVELFMTSVPD